MGSIERSRNVTEANVTEAIADYVVSDKPKQTSLQLKFPIFNIQDFLQ